MGVVLDVNGTRHEVDAPPEMPLLWALRDLVGLTGTKFGCGAGLCGACTVHVDGDAVRSCSVPIGAVARRRIVTIEGLGESHPVLRAWVDERVPQCGYCQAGMIMTTAARLDRSPSPDPTAAVLEALDEHICRCATYARIRRAVRRAAGA